MRRLRSSEQDGGFPLRQRGVQKAKRYRIGAVALVAAGVVVTAVAGNVGVAQAAKPSGTRSGGSDGGSTASTVAESFSDQRYKQLAVNAVKTGYGISESAALARVAAEPGQKRTAQTLAAELGSRQVGAWLDPATGALTIDVRDENSAAVVRRSGARARVVGARFDALHDVMRTFNAGSMPKGAAWSIDQVRAKVVLTLAAGARFAVPPAMVDKVVIERSTAALTNLVGSAGEPGAVGTDVLAGNAVAANGQIYGGLQISPRITGGTREGYCTSGFVMRAKSPPYATYLLTAGHCGRLASEWTRGGAVIGTTAEATTGITGDWSVIGINTAAWDPRPWVFSFGNAERVVGEGVNVTGTSVCARGASSGDTCGVVRAFNGSYTDSRSGTTIGGVDSTSLCTKGGDSGGPSFVRTGPGRGVYGYGIVSGGLVDPTCQRAQTYIFPLRFVPQRYELVKAS